MKRSHSRPPRVNLFVLGLFFLLAWLSMERLSSWQSVPVMEESLPTAEPAPAWEQTAPDLFVPHRQRTEGGRLPLFAVALEDEPKEKQSAALKKAKTHAEGEFAPQILIYHTHTTEAYTQTKENPYTQTSSFRTREQDKSVVAVGEALKKELEEVYGYEVIHDMTDHEPPKLATAYQRSEQTMAAYKEKYPSLEIFIDLHRDASSDSTDYVLVNGQPAARVMCVVGQGEKYEIKPDFESNLALAQAFTDSLNRQWQGLGRKVRIKPGRYNQHLSSKSLLLEVGHNANTLEQALQAVPAIAKALHEALNQTEPAPASLQKNAAADWLVPWGEGKEN